MSDEDKKGLAISNYKNRQGLYIETSDEDYTGSNGISPTVSILNSTSGECKLLFTDVDGNKTKSINLLTPLHEAEYQFDSFVGTRDASYRVNYSGNGYTVSGGLAYIHYDRDSNAYEAYNNIPDPMISSAGNFKVNGTSSSSSNYESPEESLYSAYITGTSWTLPWDYTEFTSNYTEVSVCTYPWEEPDFNWSTFDWDDFYANESDYMICETYNDYNVIEINEIPLYTGDYDKEDLGVDRPLEDANDLTFELDWDNAEYNLSTKTMSSDGIVFSSLSTFSYTAGSQHTTKYSWRPTGSPIINRNRSVTYRLVNNATFQHYIDARYCGAGNNFAFAKAGDFVQAPYVESWYSGTYTPFPSYKGVTYTAFHFVPFKRGIIDSD